MGEDDFINQYITAGETNVSNLLLHHYHEFGMTTAQLVIYLELKSALDRGVSMPDVHEVATWLETSDDQVYSQIQKMMANGLLRQGIRHDGAGKEEVYYDFSPLLERMKTVRLGNNDEDLTQATAKEETAHSQPTRQDVYNQIQQEFGRMLSPFQMDQVAEWLDRDHYSPEMILLALKEAVMNGTFKFSYMDRILLNWYQNNIKTPAEVNAEKAKFLKKRADQQQNNEVKPSQEHIPIFKLGQRTDKTKDHQKSK
ncbi:DnaD domain-containing protein [Limosilactobacillus difficilis]|uniref:DnaD domain-containing protein n=1 Tax=Limosilactobacillus difficilis TaxID=2991838 RepID=UPI0024B9EC86|nr:DnaD domain protein [Limosilactobacillus difficilis]